MDKQRRKELKEQAKLVKRYFGIYQIENLQSGKLYLGVSNNLKNQWMRQKMQLDEGKHMNAALQGDYTSLGEKNFGFSVLEEHEAEEGMDIQWELQQLEKEWLERLQPYGEKGYMKEKAR